MILQEESCKKGFSRNLVFANFCAGQQAAATSRGSTSKGKQGGL